MAEYLDDISVLLSSLDIVSVVCGHLVYKDI